jgi:serine/threonine protein kinase
LIYKKVKKTCVVGLHVHVEIIVLGYNCSSNILLDKHMEAKIGDLGLAKHATGGSQSGKLTHITKKQTGTKQYQTKAYLPPEVIRGNAMSIKGDTYSFGVVSYMCTDPQGLILLDFGK